MKTDVNATSKAVNDQSPSKNKQKAGKIAIKGELNTRKQASPTKWLATP